MTKRYRNRCSEPECTSPPTTLIWTKWPGRARRVCEKHAFELDDREDRPLVYACKIPIPEQQANARAALARKRALVKRTVKGPTEPVDAPQANVESAIVMVIPILPHGHGPTNGAMK